MKNKLLITCFFVTFSFLAYTQSLISGPVSDLGHIDVILDSATWHAIENDSFIQKEFAVLNLDTAYYGGKPSYDLYLLGQLNFLHISLAKAFWSGQQGGGVLVFQTQEPDKKDQLLESWKRFYKDSLFVHTYKGDDFTLDEIFAWYRKDSTKPKETSVFANLTTYSADAYHNWGITDSIVNAGMVMKQFMGDWGGEELKKRLFNSITELYMTLNQKEYKEIRSALLAVGYKERKNIFTHSHNPSVYISLSEEKGKSKYSKVRFSLTKSIDKKEIVFSPHATLQLNGKEGIFIFN